MLRRLTLLTAMVPALAVPVTTGAALADVRMPGTYRLSGPSPFANCAPGSGDAGKAAGAIEPVLAADPSDPRRIAAVWPQDHQRGAVIAVTRDRGGTWKRSVVPGMTRCSGGVGEYVDETTVTYTRDGALVVTGAVQMADGASAGLSVRSTDGGRTWSRPTVIVQETNPDNGGVLTTSVAAHPRDQRVLYAVTLRFPRDERTTNQVLLSRSIDGGRSWQPPRLLLDAGERRLASGHRLSVLDDGTLLNLYTLVHLRDGARHLTVQAVRSTDGGATWSPPHQVAEQRTKWFIQDPETGDHVSHTTSLLSDTAIDRRGRGPDRVYAVWQDARFTAGAADGVAMASSDDGGRTWTEPVKVNRTPATIPTPNQQTFTVSVETGRDGTVAVAYSDFRHNDTGTPLLTDRWLALCSPQPRSCAEPAAKWRETRLTPASFDMRQAPRIPDATSERGFFLGEQMGLVANGRGFTTTWATPDVPGRAAAYATNRR
ncbi:sialidase family protein [Actinomadura sp. 6N118]|uniref:sialidase family protein n=1 Tax=Actinomadura sp. 6N118 TaxID=3375151 RepID=UPI003791A8EA